MRKPTLITAFVLGATPFSSAFISVVPRSLLSRQFSGQKRANSGADDEMMSWQEGLEKLLNPFDTNFGAKTIMLQDLVGRREEVIQDVSDSIAAGKPEDLFAPDSPFRDAATGAQALRRQVEEDLLPLVVEDAPGIASSLLGSLLATVPSVLAQVLQGGDGGTAAPSLPSLEDVPKLLSDELKNVVSSTPVGLETPDYSVVLKGDGFEVRDYESYAIAATGMGVRLESSNGMYEGGTFTSSDGDEEPSTDPDDSWFRGSFGEKSKSSNNNFAGAAAQGEGAEAVEGVLSSGEAFQRLAGYLFGPENDSGEAMAMTMPVITSYKGKKASKMAFVLPRSLLDEAEGGGSGKEAWGAGLAVEDEDSGNDGDAVAAAAPRPTSARVVVSAKVPQRVAVRSFQGLATPGEIRRQLVELKASLGMAGLAMEDTPTGEDWFSVLQYNPPTTLLFLRRNEISVRLRVGDGDGSNEGGEVPVAATEQEDGGIPETDEEEGLITAEELGLPSD